jgi:hypothetical protein
MTTTTGTAVLTDAEEKLYAAYLTDADTHADEFASLRYYTGWLSSGVLDAIRTDYERANAWYERFIEFQGDVLDLGPEQPTPAVQAIFSSELERLDKARARYGDLVVHWLVKGTPIHYGDDNQPQPR